jgi:hypothetical protein
MRLRATRLSAIAHAARVALGVPVSWSPTSWFSASEQGLWYDPTDLTRYMSGGPEIISNGGFDADISGWTSVTNWTNGTWSAGSASVTTNGTFQGLAQDVTGLTVGATYALRFTVLPGSAVGRVYVGPAGAPSTISLLNITSLAAGTYVHTFRATATSHSIGLSSNAASTGPIFYDNISVRELTAISTATMYQDSAGTTPVTAVEQPVGLILDRRLGALEALGPNLVTNGTFDVDTTGWTASTSTLSAPSGRLRVTETGAAAAGFARQSFAVVSGEWYRVTLDVTTMAAAKAQVWVGSAYGGAQWLLVDNITTARPLTAFFRATTATAFFELVMSATLGGTTEYVEFDNVSVQRVPGNHAFQATSTARPTLRNRYNLFTFSEQIDNGAWGRTNIQGVTVNAIAAPDGTTTADLVIPNTTSGAHIITNASSVGAAGAHTLTIRVKPGGYSKFALRDQSAGTVDAAFHLSGAGSVMWVTGATASVSIAAIEDGWYLITATSTLSAATAYRFFILPDAYTSGTLNSYSWSGDGTSGIYTWGAQVVPAADASLPYQRIAAATDYDSDASKFPLYLAFDGSDDSLATGSINFSGTDKMTVVAGLVQNTTSTQIIAELSANASSTAGTFALYFENTGTFNIMRAGTVTGLNFYQSTVQPRQQRLTVAGSVDLAGTTADTEIPDLRVTGTPAKGSAGGVQNTGTGNFGTYPIFIGRRNSASFSLNGRIHQLIIRGAASTDIAQAESFVAARTGVTI